MNGTTCEKGYLDKFRILDDIAFLMSLAGNDFVPATPSIAVTSDIALILVSYENAFKQINSTMKSKA